MLKKWIDQNSVVLTPQNPDDILGLRRVIRSGDTISGQTTWVLKQERQYARPDKGERIRLKITMSADRISLDSLLDRLRIRGIITDSDNEAMPRGIPHSLLLGVGQSVRVYKKRWSLLDKKLIDRRDEQEFILAAIDRSECGLALLSGTHIQYIPDIRSGSGGKRYKVSFDMDAYLARVGRAIDALVQDREAIIIFGPGETKRRLANHLEHCGYSAVVSEGVDTAGQDGIYQFARSNSLKQAISGSRMARALSMIDDIMRMAGQGSRKFTMGFSDTHTAVLLGAVESVAYSDGIFALHDENSVVQLLNDAEEMGASVYGVDSSTDLGMRVTQLGGVVSVLRYAAG